MARSPPSLTFQGEDQFFYLHVEGEPHLFVAVVLVYKAWVLYPRFVADDERDACASYSGCGHAWCSELLFISFTSRTRTLALKLKVIYPPAMRLQRPLGGSLQGDNLDELEDREVETIRWSGPRVS